MPVRGRWILLAAAVAGAALGAGPAVGAKHHKARWVAIKARAHGHAAPRSAGRPPLIGTLPVTTPATTTPPATTDPTTPPPTCPTALGVTEDEYHTYVSRPSLCPGSILIQLRNTGEDPHNLEVLNLDTNATVATWGEAEPGDVVTKRVTLVAGTYRLFCTLPGHDELGMHTVVTVG